MCLIRDSNVPITFDENGVGTFYKLIQKFGKIPVSFGGWTWRVIAESEDLFCGPFRGTQYKLGLNVANGPIGTPLREEPVHSSSPNYEVNEVNYGFHVFTELQEAIKYHKVLKDNNRNYSITVIEVVCHKKHLIAVGRWEDTSYQQAAFTRMTIDSFKPVEV